MAHIEIQAGATFRTTAEWREADGTTPVSMAGRAARMHLRRKITDAEPLLNLTSAAGGGLTIHPGGAIGDLAIYIPATTTAGLPTVKPDKPGVWDLELYDPNNLAEVDRIGEGTFEVSPEVTR